MKKAILLLCLPLLFSCGGGSSDEEVEVLSPIIEKALNNTTSKFYADFASFPTERTSLPIGVFDSGTGGLTVLEVLLSIDKMNNITGEEGSDGVLDFAGEDFSYFADRANMPYGLYASKNKEHYFKELVVKDALFMLDDKYYTNGEEEVPQSVKKPSKIVVIACNTATAYGLKEVDTLLTKSNTGVKVIGVINAGVNALFNKLSSDRGAKDEKDSVAVGVMATMGTISSGAYEREIFRCAKESGYLGYLKVVNQPGAGFAEAVDGEKEYVNSELKELSDSYRGPIIGVGDNDIDASVLGAYNFDFTNNGVLVQRGYRGKIEKLQLNSAANYARFHLVSIFEKLRKSGVKVPLKHVILGCTHYPYQLEVLNETIAHLKDYESDGIYIYRDLIADNFSFIDPAMYTAIECYKTLRADKQLAFRTRDGKVDAYISVPAYGLSKELLDGNYDLSSDFKYGRELNTEDITTVQVPFTKENIGEEVLERISAQLPYSYSKIKNIIE